MAFNIVDYRKLIGIEELAEAIEAHGDDAAVPRVSIASRMGILTIGHAIPENGPDEAANALLEARRRARSRYGCASNARFVATFMREDPMLSEFVVHNCRCGVFSGEVHHVHAAVMVQILSYLRYMEADTFAKSNLEKQAQYQAYAMAEMMGAFIPAEKRCQQNRARNIIIDAVNYGLQTEDFLVDMSETWFNPVIGPWNAQDQVVATDINEALSILMAWAATVDTSRRWFSNMNLFLNVITSLSKRGNVSEDAQAKIQEGVGEDLSTRHVYVNPVTCQRFYKSFGKWINGDNARALFRHYLALVPDWSMRMTLTIQQASGAGLTVYFIIVRALKLNPDFNWARAYKLLSSEFAAFNEAAALVQNNPFYGYNQDLGNARSTFYPSLGYLCQQLCIRANGDNRLGRYAGLKTGIVMKDSLVELVDAYVDRKANVAMTDEELLANIGHINNIRAHLDLEPIVVNN